MGPDRNKIESRAYYQGITGIDINVLSGKRAALHGASVAQKMSWAASRETTREEDTAYCLMWIFNVNMPMLYGEGTRAFQRLQEEILRTVDDQTIFAWRSINLGTICLAIS